MSRVGPCSRAACKILIACAAVVAGTRSLQDAVANGDTRAISLYQTHTKESVTVTFKRNGVYDREALEKLNWILRDWRRDEPIAMDPKLFDVAWAVHREVGSRQPLHVVSGYRAPETNAMLRRRSSAVAKQSQHMRGKAMDFYLPDANMAQVRAIAMRLQRGGVGYYPTAFNPFVHLDVGSVRSWPRMTRDQLSRLFPDGKTVHIPADGKPMAGYELARAEIMSRGDAVAGSYTAYAEAESAQPSGSRKSFWASLFGLEEEEDEDFAKPNGNTRTRVASSGAAPSGGDAAVADNSNVSFFLRDRRGGSAPAAQPQAPRPTAVAAVAPQAQPQVAQAPAAAAPATAPLPQARPDDIAPAAAPAAEAPVALALAPVPPRRPEDAIASVNAIAATAVVANVPVPPSRPVSFAAAGLGSQEIGTRATSDESGALAALAAAAATRPPATRVAGLVPMAYAAADVPVPPIRPGLTAAVSPAVAEEARPAPQVRRPVAAAAVPRVLRPLFGGDPVEPPTPSSRIAMAHAAADTSPAPVPAGRLAAAAFTLALPLRTDGPEAPQP